MLAGCGFPCTGGSVVAARRQKGRGCWVLQVSFAILELPSHPLWWCFLRNGNWISQSLFSKPIKVILRLFALDQGVFFIHCILDIKLTFGHCSVLQGDLESLYVLLDLIGKSSIKDFCGFLFLWCLWFQFQNKTDLRINWEVHLSLLFSNLWRISIFLLSQWSSLSFSLWGDFFNHELMSFLIRGSFRFQLSKSGLVVWVFLKFCALHLSCLIYGPKLPQCLHALSLPWALWCQAYVPNCSSLGPVFLIACFWFTAPS